MYCTCPLYLSINLQCIARVYCICLKSYNVLHVWIVFICIPTTYCTCTLYLSVILQCIWCRPNYIIYGVVYSTEVFTAHSTATECATCMYSAFTSFYMVTPFLSRSLSLFLSLSFFLPVFVSRFLSPPHFLFIPVHISLTLILKASLLLFLSLYEYQFHSLNSILSHVYLPYVSLLQFGCRILFILLQPLVFMFFLI